MKWSLLVGKFWGTEVRLHVSMLLIIPYVLVISGPNEIAGTLRILLIIAALFVCVALHEMGHTAAARLYGIEVKNIVLWPLGGVANLSRRPDKVLPDLIISAAGPLTNLVLFAGLGLLALLTRALTYTMIFPGLSSLLIQWDVFAILTTLTIANLGLALFNLVPIYPLDGGQITRNLIKLAFGEKWADRIMLIISLPAALALVIAGIAAGDLMLLLTGLLLALASASLNLHILNGLNLLMLFFIDRGGFYLKRNDYDPAAQEYTKAIQHNPKRAGAYVSRAVVYMNLLEFARARADVDLAIALEPDNFIAWALRGELLAAEKDYMGALLACSRSIELNPTWPVAFLDRGSIYQERGDLPLALADMNRAIELGRSSPISYLVRSVLLYQMGDLDASHADAEKALHYAPSWMLVFPEVFILSFEDHLEWALEYYGKAVERFSNAHQAYQGRADAYRINHHAGWAIEDYTRAIKLAPRTADLYLSRGIALQTVGAMDKAMVDFQQAAQLADRSHIRRLALQHLNELAASSSPAHGPSAPPAPPAEI